MFYILFYYFRYTAKERAQIGKYAHLHGITATAKHFSRKMGVTVSKPTVQSILKSYVVGVRGKRALEDEDDEDRGTGLTVLPCKKRGRPLLLGPELDKKVQLYLRRVRDAGGVVTARIAVAAAKGVIKRFDKFKLAEYGGPIELNVAWAYALLERMGFVKRKATTAKSKYEVEKFKELKCAFLNDVKITVEMEDIPAKLILNWDQTGIRIIPY